jgi:hypothetical protein
VEGVAGEEPGLDEEVIRSRAANKNFPKGTVMIRFGVAIVVGLCAAPAFASSPDPKDLAIPQEALTRARELVRQLASDLFRERENAHAELNKMGRLAKPVLADAVHTDPDPEVRARASRLLHRATADDLKARLDTFLADADGRFQHDLPGWASFKKAAGADKAARDLYAEVVKTPANMELLASLDKPTAVAGRAITDRRHALYAILNRRFQGIQSTGPGQSITVPDITALLVAEAVIDNQHIPPGQYRFLGAHYFLQQPPASTAISGTGVAHAEPFRKLVAAWMDTRNDPNEMQNLAYLVSNQLRGFKEAVPLLRRIVANDAVQGWARGTAVTALVREKGKDEIPTLKAMLKNENQLVSVFLGNNVGGNNNASLQVRDLALAHLLTLHDQDLKSFGFEAPQLNGQVLNATAFGQYAFPTDDARKAGFKKWAEFVASQKSPRK